MGSSANQGYCAFTKAIEHLGDRWSFLIVRELAMFGPQGFNTLASGLPGRISRSVLADRLRKLEDLGLVIHDDASGSRLAPYRLAPAGHQLVPTLKSLWDWAKHWVPEDPAMAERDPSVIGAWLEHRVDRSASPVQQVAIELLIRGVEADRVWLLLARDSGASLCLDDPLLDSDRYVYVETDAARLFPIARGQRSWSDAIADGSVKVYGDPELVRELPTWFSAPDVSERAPRAGVAAA
ncbi:MAG TPA: helix-turn-helix domain-containing protein [Candidatus Binatia bacterium]|nr:helix-turn-helix domain-containing protein [Candidatus Binatia bacterium]